jgi:hypothetical protein
MTSTNYSRFRRATGAALALVAAVAACDRDTVAPPMPPSTSSGLQLSVEASSATASKGQRIAVAVRAEYAKPLGGLQGYLRFNPGRLRYVGETTLGPVLLVNHSRIDAGEVRFGSMDAQDIGMRVGTFVFEVLGPGYTDGLVFDVEAAATTEVTRIRATTNHRSVRVANDLQVPTDAKRRTFRDNSVALNLGAVDSMPLLTPGQVVPGLVYGDVDLGATAGVTLVDALIDLNVSVGNQQLIIGTNAPAVDVVIAGNVDPPNSPGLGEPGDALPPGAVNANDQGSIDLLDALAVLIETVNPPQAVTGEIIPGRPASAPTDPSCPTGRVVVSAAITTNTTWVKGCVYELAFGSPAITVSGGATLTIQPGVRVEGQRSPNAQTNAGALFVARDGRLIADGTAREPIVLTCVGTPKAKGCWGGLVVNGNATLNDGTATSPIIAGRAATGGCNEKSGEGSSGLYGGCNAADSSGVFRYMIVEYGGFRFNTTNELNGIAFQGVGNKTVVDYVQSHAGQDDGFEFFGGTVNVKHLYLTANSDDSMDWTEGWSGNAQFVIIQHDPLDSDKGIEADNFEFGHNNAPRAAGQIWNVTMYGKSNPTDPAGVSGNNSLGGMNVRRGTRPTFGNFIVGNFPFQLDIDDVATCDGVAPAPPNAFVMQNSILEFVSATPAARIDASDTGDPAGCNGDELAFLNAQVGNTLRQGLTSVADLTARDPLNQLLPDFRPRLGLAAGGATPPAGGFFDTSATYQGACPPANASASNVCWYMGWTRGFQGAGVP